MIDLTDSDPTTIIPMCQKGCAKWKEIACVKIHDTLLERKKKAKEKGKMKSFHKKGELQSKIEKSMKITLS